MLLIPAIDLHDGNCVRLVRGRLENITVYSENPAEMAKKWEVMGAKRLHVVDLDGAFTGAPKNTEAIKDICSSVSIPVEVGGGIRNVETIEQFLEIGAKYVILGTAAVKDPLFLSEACRLFQGNIILGIDAKNGFVSLKGWTEEAALTPVELAISAKELGVSAVIYTDISKDGTLTGPNLAATKELAVRSGMPVIASGGMATLDDVAAVAELEPSGVIGAILGKSIYEGKIDLGEALRMVCHAC